MSTIYLFLLLKYKCKSIINNIENIFMQILANLKLNNIKKKLIYKNMIYFVNGIKLIKLHLFNF